MCDTIVMHDTFNGYIYKTPSNDTYLAGWKDYEAGYYWPLPPSDAMYGEYIRGWNDAWAKANNRKLAR